MLDESITSSPSKTNKSIHNVRLLRKTKRKKIEKNIQNSDQKEDINVDKILYDFYKDSEDEADDIDGTFLITKPSAIIKNYKPFEMEKQLAMADRLTSSQRDDRIKSDFPENPGFNTCQTIKEIDGLRSLTKQESSFLITESELINCCYQAEKVLEEKEPALQTIDMELLKSLEHDIASSSHKIKPSSPNHLVNSILRDFSQSPLTKDQTVIFTSWQHTPEFRLRRKPVKTYSRKFLNRTRTNLNKRLESVTSDDGSSNCTSISTQEDVAPLEGALNGALMDTSQRLCQNLLNLSAFFTQNSSTNSSQDQLNDQNSSETLLLVSSQDRLLNTISSTIDEILKLRSSYPDKLRTSSYSSNQNFFGFPSQNDEDDDDNGIDLVVDNDLFHLNKTIIEHSLALEEQTKDISTDVTKGEYNNWIEDGCESVFTTINTDEISLLSNRTKSHPKSHNLTNNKELLFESVISKSPEIVEQDDESLNQAQNCEKFIGFKTASSKTIKVSRNAHIVAAQILSKLPDIPNKPEINNYDNSDAKKDTTSKEVNIFENSDDYEWNDECDFFMNFKTPVDGNEKQQKAEILKEKFTYTNDFPSTSKMAMKAHIGFQTAAGKNVSISKKAQESVKKLLKEFETDFNGNENIDELIEMKMKIFTKTHNVNTEKSNFQNKMENGDNGNEILEKNSNIIEGHCKEDILDKRDKNEFANTLFKGNMGFQTVHGKNIKISTRAQENVEKLLNESLMDSNENFDFAEIKDKSRSYITKPITENYRLKESNTQHEETNEHIKVSANAQQSEDLAKETSKDCDKEIQLQNGFQTANGKKVIISAKAQHSVEQLLKEFNTDFQQDNFIEDLQTIKNNIQSKSNKLEAKETSNGECEDLANIVLSEWPLSNRTLLSNSEHENGETKTTGLLKDTEKCHTVANNCDIANMKINSNIGFQTAKGNKVSISAKAQQAVDKLLQEFRSDLTATDNEEYLKDMKSKIEMKNKQLKEGTNHLDLKTAEDLNEYSNMIFSEWPLLNKHDLIQNSSPKQLMGKRKLSLDNSDIPSPITARSPPSKIIHKGLFSTKSSFNESSLKSPLNSSPAHSVISRKNLLSLTKRRKNKRKNSVTNVSQDSNEKEIPKIYKELVATPIKSSITTSIQTPATPNLKQFFSNAPQTSTPREENKLSSSGHKSMDIDFKPINWDNINDTTPNKSKLSMSNRTTKLSDSTCSNISLNSSNPTAKERIARLKMYGKPPAFSPILIDAHNSRRPSGLRRTRSMLKKTENK